MQDRHVRWVEIIIAVSVVVISVASLFVAVYQSHVMQRQLEASVLPILSYSHGNYDVETETQLLAFTIGNRGLGPADIHTLHLVYEGERYSNLYSYFQACCVDADQFADDNRQHAWTRLFQDHNLAMTTSTVRGQLLAPGDDITFIHLPQNEEEGPARQIWEALNQARWSTEVELCYCSVFDQCWRTHFPGNARTEVRACEIEAD